MDLDFLKRLAKAITEQFGDNSEVVVHDLTGGDLEHTVVAIENGHVSRRQMGDGPSRVVLETLKHRGDRAIEDQLGYLTRTRDGRILKSSTVFLHGGDGAVEGVLAINYDVTEMLMAERAIDSLLHHREEQKAPERIPQNVNDLLDDLIEQLSAYIQSTGRKYADHAATLRIWTKRQKTEQKSTPGIPDYTFKEGESL